MFRATNFSFPEVSGGPSLPPVMSGGPDLKKGRREHLENSIIYTSVAFGLDWGEVIEAPVANYPRCLRRH